MVGFFQIQAEYLHLFTGRRCAVDVGGGKVPFRITAVTYQPENNLVLAKIATPVFQLTELAFTPDAIVEVEQIGAVR